MKILLIMTMAIFQFMAQVRPEEPILTRTSYGKITFGDRLEKVELDLKMKAIAKNGDFDYDCNYVNFAVYPLVDFMVEKGIITRADVSEGVPNEFGISVGDLFDDVKNKYPEVIIEMHPYDPQGHYLIFKSKDGKNAIIMEEGEGKIFDIRAGCVPSVEYVEHCL